MKKEYVKPLTEEFILPRESVMARASHPDEYSIGGDNSQWPEDGPIEDDYGDGPGVTGAKENDIYFDLWE